MPAADRRLIDWAAPARVFIVVGVCLGLVGCALLVAQSWLLAELIADTVSGARRLDGLATPLVMLLAVFVARAGVAAAVAGFAHRSSATVKSQLRRAFLDKVLDLGPTWLASRPRTELETLGTRGLDALDPYFGGFLPQVVLASVVPAVVTVAVASQDLVAAGIMLFTLPLVPLFMAVVGVGTKASTNHRLGAMQRLAGQFLDNVAGLGTLKVFGATSGGRRVQASSEDFRRVTMLTLRKAFMSSLVLELTASLSIAVVAVSVGLRLVNGTMDLRTGLFVLVLAPEAYQPLRALAAQFHSSADGKAAAGQVFEVLDAPVADGLGAAAPVDLATELIRFEHATVQFPDRPSPALLDLSFTASPGEVVALIGPTGCGKSTALGALLGFVELESGVVTVGERDLCGLDLRSWRTQVAWVPQHPYLFARSLRDNIALGRPAAERDLVAHAVESAGLSGLIDRLPAGLDTVIGENGSGISAGERQRVALARAFLVDAPLLVLDEPTAHLDGETEQAVLSAVHALIVGRTVVMAAHRHALLDLADRVVDVDRARLGSPS